MRSSSQLTNDGARRTTGTAGFRGALVALCLLATAPAALAQAQERAQDRVQEIDTPERAPVTEAVEATGTTPGPAEKLPIVAPAAATSAADETTAGTPVGDAPLTQLALALDTSSSMQGLVDQAKTQLWSVVNELALARQNGKPVALQVALYEYGNNRLDPATLWIRPILGFTDNLDLVSEELFKLRATTISNSNEYCGAAIRAAVRQLAWSDRPSDLKILCVAGNESFQTGPVASEEACREAIERGVLVNTIFCGNFASGVSLGWQAGARLSDGTYTAIDHNLATVRYAAPQDDEIERLGVELNGTYLPFGELGAEGQSRQVEQDRNAIETRRQSSVDRWVFKSSRLYQNSTWDLLDALDKGTVKLESLEKEKLPAQLRDLSLEECKLVCEELGTKRATLQKQIAELSRAREAFVEQAKLADTTRSLSFQNAAGRNGVPGARTRSLENEAAPDLDEAAGGSAEIGRPGAPAAPPARELRGALVETLRAQARKKGIEIPEKEKPADAKPEANSQTDETQTDETQTDETQTDETPAEGDE